MRVIRAPGKVAYLTLVMAQDGSDTEIWDMPYNYFRLGSTGSEAVTAVGELNLPDLSFKICQGNSDLGGETCLIAMMVGIKRGGGGACVVETGIYLPLLYLL